MNRVDAKSDMRPRRPGAVCALALLLLVGLFLPVRTHAQTVFFTASVTNSTVLVTNPVTFFFTLTNNNPQGSTLFSLFTSNSFSGPVMVSDYSTNQGGLFYGFSSNGTQNTNALVFDFGDLTFPTNYQNFFLTIVPQSVGLLTNTITVGTSGTNVLTTNLVVNVVGPAVDLSVTNLGLQPAAYAFPAYLNDRVTSTLLVSNAGPGGVGSILLTNSLPPGLQLTAVSPAGTGYSVTSNTLVLNLNGLADGASETVSLTFQPTNTGIYLLTTLAVAPGYQDLNPTNNFTFGLLSANAYDSTNLLAWTNGPTTYNAQNGTVELPVLVTNTSATAVSAIRLVLTGLTNPPFNLVDTNWVNGTNPAPFVVSPAPLLGHQSTTLTLQFPRTAFSVSNGQLHAYGVALPTLTPPTATGVSTNINSSIHYFPSGVNQHRVMLTFPTLTGSNYLIVYANNPFFTNALTAQPPLTAPANITQWIDYGPPGTASALTNSSQRYYRVLFNP